MNYILIGMPGSGKSTLGKLLAEELNLNFVDFDDDILESVKGKTVGELVDNLSVKDFMKLEEDLCVALKFQNTVFSTSGSIPYSAKAINHLKTLGTIIYLKVNVNEIKARMSEMKIDRIIGLGGKQLDELLDERETLYINSSDIIFTYSGSDFKRIIKQLGKELLGKQ